MAGKWKITIQEKLRSDTKRNEGRMGIKEKIRKEIDTANFYKLNKLNIGPMPYGDGVRRVTLFCRLCNYSTAGITKKQKVTDVIENILHPAASFFPCHNSKLLYGMGRPVVFPPSFFLILFLCRPISLLWFFFSIQSSEYHRLKLDEANAINVKF